MPSRSKTKSAPSKVDYRNPPVQAQFKKGQSGNPAGRSRRPRSLTEALLEDFLASWERHGVSVLERVTPQNRGSCAGTMPLTVLRQCWRSRLPVLRLIWRNETRSAEEHAAWTAIGQ